MPHYTRQATPNGLAIAPGGVGTARRSHFSTSRRLREVCRAPQLGLLLRPVRTVGMAGSVGVWRCGSITASPPEGRR